MLRAEGVEVVKQVTRHPHTCSLPRWRERRRLDLGYGSIVRCNYCGSLWEWISGYDGPRWFQKDTGPESSDSDPHNEGEQ